MNDIRWIQRFQNLKKAFQQLKNAVELAKTRELSILEKQGLIQSFEYTHELAWKTLKDFFNEKGIFNIYGSKDSTREAFKNGLIDNGDVWMQMILSRNLSSRTYDEKTAEEIVSQIINKYYSEFEILINKLEKLKEEFL
ncbi:nucleotidyltransferase substrate binding protein [Marinitoga litoralis]|uniref:nucleotidyltransferase substrate binding protein n=1 Tax=Marinitoga litoralis TaxID=570855 RepID=UPI001960908A|nr:nucleotidyltransferase substrate binding protein [Marinitoga litoralis]MBM7559995.1 nucleotidyltransferase substrate binding protein (TIGR01987 family) [Marinitoga litoralis]